MIDLFGEERRRPRRVIMHAVDTGHAPGLLEGWRTTSGAHFVCVKCGRDDDWSFDLSPSEIRRGLPCQVCNHIGCAEDSTMHAPRMSDAETKRFVEKMTASGW